MGADTLIPWANKIAAETIRPARGKILEEVLIKREAGGVQRIVLDRAGEDMNELRSGVAIKEEPNDYIGAAVDIPSRK